jgi:hypothetical protein
MRKRSTFIGLDVHKESIAVAIAEGGRFGEVRAYGSIGGEVEALNKVVRTLRAPGSATISNRTQQRALLVAISGHAERPPSGNLRVRRGHGQCPNPASVGGAKRRTLRVPSTTPCSPA